MLLSLIITAKSEADPKLQDLLASIEEQEFPEEDFETLIITEGTSESAKAIGIRRAKGEYIGILASDNVLSHPFFLSHITRRLGQWVAHYPVFYEHDWNDGLLTRYFALIGGNDPLSFYMGKNDKLPYWRRGLKDAVPHGYSPEEKTIGDNGFFIRRDLINQTDLDNYYHIDNAVEALKKSKMPVFLLDGEIKHNTGGNLLSFIVKRYKYGLQHAFNSRRRWHLVDLKNPRDLWKLVAFCLLTITILEPLITSMRGYLKKGDLAWFMHPVVCLMTLLTYAVLMLHVGIRGLFQSLSVLTGAQKA